MNKFAKIIALLCLSIPLSAQAVPTTWDYSWTLGYNNPPGQGGGEPFGFGIPVKSGDTVNGSVTFESTTPDTGQCTGWLGSIFCPTAGIGIGEYKGITNLSASLPTYDFSGTVGSISDPMLLSNTANGMASFSTDSGIINVANVTPQMNNPPPVADYLWLDGAQSITGAGALGNTSGTKIPYVTEPSVLSYPQTKDRYWEMVNTSFYIGNYDGALFDSYDLPQTLPDSNLIDIIKASLTFELFEKDGSTINNGLRYTFYAQDSIDFTLNIPGSGGTSGTGGNPSGNVGGSGNGAISVPEPGTLALLSLGLLSLVAGGRKKTHQAL